MRFFYFIYGENAANEVLIPYLVNNCVHDHPAQWQQTRPGSHRFYWGLGVGSHVLMGSGLLRLTRGREGFRRPANRGVRRFIQRPPPAQGAQRRAAGGQNPFLRVVAIGDRLRCCMPLHGRQPCFGHAPDIQAPVAITGSPPQPPQPFCFLGQQKTARRRLDGFRLNQQPGISVGYAPATEMPLNSPVAIFSFQTAGPVMWALVPPASTATVTGMSTTSNS